MEATSSSSATHRSQGLPSHALVVVVIELVAAGCGAFMRAVERLAAAQRRAQARRTLHGLSDHFLKDIGLERSQIDRLFG